MKDDKWEETKPMLNPPVICIKLTNNDILAFVSQVSFVLKMLSSAPGISV